MRARRPRSEGYHRFVSRVRIAFFVFLAGTVIGVYFAMQAYWNPAIMPPLRWSQAIGINLTYYYLWAVTTPLVVMMALTSLLEISLVTALAASSAFD